MIGQRLLHYQITKKLGVGGQATAYLARDTKLGRTVVLKLLDPKMANNDLVRRRFLREARLAATLDHPNICTIHEINEAGGHYFIVMQYIDGETLKSLISRKKLPLETSLAIALQVADGLAAAHRTGIVHRDMKASNIMIASSGRPSILDFGLAKALPDAKVEDLDVTHAGSVGKPFGTPSYMSPEQARGDSVIDARSDVFSFGIILYEMLTGQKPFTGKNSVEIMHSILHNEPRLLRDPFPVIDPELERIIFRALKKDVAARYPTAVEMLGELRVVARKLGLQDIAAVHALVANSQRKVGVGRQLLLSTIGLLQSTASFIENIVTRKARITAAPDTQDTSQGSLSSTRTSSKLSLAILPLKSIVKNKDYEHFGIGLADNLITELAVVGDLMIRPVRTVLKYEDKEVDPLAVGQEMGVDVVLDGSYQIAGGILRATLRLFDVRTGEDIWTERFDQPLEDLFTLQDHVARRVIEGLRIHLTDYEKEKLRTAPAGVLAAYDYYTRAKYLFERTHARRDFDAAIDLFRRAIEVDKEFVPAYSGLAKLYFLLWMGYDNNPKWLDDAESVCREAIRLNPNFAESYSAMASVYLERGCKREAFEQLQTALKLAPNDLETYIALGWFYRWSGLLDKAINSYKIAIKIDPGYWRAYWGLALTCVYLGQLEEAEKQIGYFLTKIDPQNPVLRFVQGDIWFYQGKYDQARQIGEMMKAAAPELTFGQVLLAKVYAALGQSDKAREEFGKVNRLVGPQGDYFYWRGQIHAMLGENALAIEQLLRSIRIGNENYIWYERDQTFDGLRSDPSFVQLMSDLRERWTEYQEKY
jgi:serine/threonine protein kinase/tetratricopeptide (TPR) repeat protein